MSTVTAADGPSAPSGIFLSYARDDLAAAQRLRDGLAGAGLEVFFDLRGLESGDDFDALIRRHIQACKLFVPIISAATQNRPEAYFRLEWHLAEERARQMAKSVAFILPVVIDDTPESAALVPDKFLQVQWTRLREGNSTPEFRQRVTRLLVNRVGIFPTTSPFGPSVTAPSPPTAEEKSSSSRRRRWRLLMPAIVVVALVFWGGGRYALSLPFFPVAAHRLAQPVSEKSIAVLPFANLSPDPDNAFFADGVHEDVIVSLAKIHDLKVISRTSVLAYRDPAQRQLRKIAAELGVASILEGSVRRMGNKVRVVMQLIDAATDRTVWTDTYDRDLSDVFTVQAALAQEITSALKANLTGGERNLIGQRPTQNQEAYDLYTRARTMQLEIGLNGTLPQYEAVTSLYEAAIAKDPKFTLAYMQLAVTHGFVYFFADLDPSVARLERMRRAAESARQIAPDLPETHMAFGAYLLQALEPGRGLKELHEAEIGLPNDAQLLFLIAATLSELGRLPEALSYYERSTAINPSDLATAQLHIEALIMLRRFSAASDIAARYAKRFPEYRRFALLEIKARFGLNGNRLAGLLALETLPDAPTENERLTAAYQNALRRGNYGAAERALANPKLTKIVDEGGIVVEPVSLHRAMLAIAQGKPDRARPLAEEALVFFRSQTWTPRQMPWAQMRVAWAELLAGHSEVGVRQAKATFGKLGLDSLDALWMRHELAYAYLLAGKTEEALETLQEMMSKPAWLTPNEIRDDPAWASVKTDPRFEKALRSAQVF